MVTIIAIIVIIFLLTGIYIVFNALKKDKCNETNKKSETTCIKVPEIKIYGVNFIDEDEKPYVGLINTALLDVTPHNAFQWLLSLTLFYEYTMGCDMPDNNDIILMQDFLDELDINLVIDEKNPNAVFLARYTGDGSTRTMWYVRDPEIANTYLQNIINEGNYPFQFQFIMSKDEVWQEAHYWIDPCLNNESQHNFDTEQ